MAVARSLASRGAHSMPLTPSSTTSMQPGTRVAMAIRPMAAGGLAWVLATFAGFLVLYEIIDIDVGREGFGRSLIHLPVVFGAVLAVLVWQRDRAGSGPQLDPSAMAVVDDIVLPENASRGRRRSHLRSSDGSAA